MKSFFFSSDFGGQGQFRGGMGRETLATGKLEAWKTREIDVFKSRPNRGVANLIIAIVDKLEPVAN